MVVLILQDDIASIKSVSRAIIKLYSYAISNDCAISQEKLFWSINQLKYIRFMAESHQAKVFANNILMRTAERNWIESIQTVNQGA
jgi:hypothetical protein